MRDATREATRLLGVLVLSGAGVAYDGVLPSSAHAQEACAEEVGGAARAPWLLWSERSDQSRVAWAMWTLHVNHVDEGWSNDATAGVIHRGAYAATFRTSHGRRGLTVGVERAWTSVERGPFGIMLGFRSGLVYGYDGRLGWLAEALPILPMLQPLVYGRVGPMTADFSYTRAVVSLTGGVRF
jgi:hypothetical protein